MTHWPSITKARVLTVVCFWKTRMTLGCRGYMSHRQSEERSRGEGKASEREQKGRKGKERKDARKRFTQINTDENALPKSPIWMNTA
jgi:hypothetical protein